jgi:hypothetical protein
LATIELLVAYLGVATLAIFVHGIHIKLLVDRVLRSIRRFHFSNREADLLPARKILKAISERSSKGGGHISKIVIKGWKSVKSVYRFDLNSIRLANPELKITIRRGVRLDLLSHREGLGLFVGFTLVAKAKRTSKNFHKVDFFVTDPNGLNWSLEFSNTAASQVSKVSMNLREYPREPGQGYVDEVRVFRGSDHLSLVFDQLSLQKTKEMTEFARSNLGDFVCESISKRLRDFGREEEAEKFEFMAGSTNSIFSIHRHVSVIRHFAPRVASDLLQSRPLEMLEVEQDYVVPNFSKGQLLAPGPGWLKLRDAEIVSGCLLVSGNELHCYEYAADPKWDFVSGLWQIQFGTEKRLESALLKLPTNLRRKLKEVILIGGRNDSNYYHFMIEYLPRILEVPPSISSEVPVVVSNRVPDSGIEALRALTEREILRIDPEFSYSAEIVHVASPVTQVLDTSKVSWSNGLFMHSASLHAFRSACLSAVGSRLNSKNRIFLTRSSGHRSIKNEAKLSQIAEREGFINVDIANLSWRDQVTLFSNAEIIVGAGGAVMANYLFSREGSRILCLVSRHSATFSLPAQIAAVAGASFSYLLGKPVLNRHIGDDFQSLVHSDFIISPRKFRRVLRQEVAKLPT